MLEHDVLGHPQAAPPPQRMTTTTTMMTWMMTRTSTRRTKRRRSCPGPHTQSRPKESARPALHSSVLQHSVAQHLGALLVLFSRLYTQSSVPLASPADCCVRHGALQLWAPAMLTTTASLTTLLNARMC